MPQSPPDALLYSESSAVTPPRLETAPSRSPFSGFQPGLFKFRPGASNRHMKAHQSTITVQIINANHPLEGTDMPKSFSGGKSLGDEQLGGAPCYYAVCPSDWPSEEEKETLESPASSNTYRQALSQFSTTHLPSLYESFQGPSFAAAPKTGPESPAQGR